MTSRGFVSVIDLDTNTTIARVHTPGGVDTAVDPSRDTVYVATGEALYVIQPVP